MVGMAATVPVRKSLEALWNAGVNRKEESAWPGPLLTSVGLIPEGLGQPGSLTR